MEPNKIQNSKGSPNPATEEHPVAVFSISGNSNEDAWAQATWQAEIAARKAAEEAGTPKEAVKIRYELGGRRVIASNHEGREFQAWVVTNESQPPSIVPQQKNPQEYWIK
ncbi:hypothetical protein [Nocardiopsis dassonvillei]|uniref:hypothetical protein n=1 Tax=Nocardiopsis dassonvillei TaxID=2014 RepID=UPI00157C43A0|nr:hypothetical protein [Nocardiopsis dassonvillei]